MRGSNALSGSGVFWKELSDGDRILHFKFEPNSVSVHSILSKIPHYSLSQLWITGGSIWGAFLPVKADGRCHTYDPDGDRVAGPFQTAINTKY